jgi:hypothetical protein
VYKIFVGKPEGNRPFRRPKRRWDGIRMDRRSVWSGFNWLRIRAGGELL